MREGGANENSKWQTFVKLTLDVTSTDTDIMPERSEGRGIREIDREGVPSS